MGLVGCSRLTIRNSRSSSCSKLPRRSYRSPIGPISRISPTTYTPQPILKALSVPRSQLEDDRDPRNRQPLLHCAKGQSLNELFLSEPSEHHDWSHRQERCGG
jgi:hypothetical protein